MELIRRRVLGTILLLAVSCRHRARQSAPAHLQTVDTSGIDPLARDAGPDVSPPRADASAASASELDRLLADRPRLRETLESRPGLREWLSMRFEGNGQPFAVRWDPTEPQSGQPAEHLQPQVPGSFGSLRVGARYSGSDQLAGVVFEFINMEGATAMAEAWNEARTRRLSREAFAVRMTRLEHRAIVTFQQFAREHDLPADQDDVLLPRLLGAPVQFEAFVEWVARMRGPGATHSPGQYWSRAYDAAMGSAAQGGG